MNKEKRTWPILITLAAMLGIGTVRLCFPPVAAAEEQHQGHDQHDHRDHDDGHESHAGHDDEHEGHDEHKDEHDGHEDHEDGVVHLNESQLSGLKLTHVKARRGSLTNMVELTGAVAWNADRLVHVTPRVVGIVSSVKKTLGDRVEFGEVLCELDSREMGDAKMEYLADLSRFEVARADFKRAQTVYENTKKLLKILDPEPMPEQALLQAHDLPVGNNKNQLLTSYTRMKVNFRNYKRNEELLASRIASEAEFLRAKGEYEVSRADYLSTREEISFDLDLRFLRAEKDYKVAETEMRNAERALHILGLTNEQTEEIAGQGAEVDSDISLAVLFGPISGVIVDRHLTRGELVNTDTRLYTIADLSDVWVMGRAYERDIRFLRRGQKATVRIDAFPGQLFEGEVNYVASQLDPDTRTIQVRVVLPNQEERLRPGMFGTVVIQVGNGDGKPNQSGVLVPTNAVQRIKDGFAVFLAVKPGEYKMVPVQVVRKTREFTEIAGTITVGDLVAVGDTFVLKSEAGKAEMGGGHSH